LRRVHLGSGITEGVRVCGGFISGLVAQMVFGFAAGSYDSNQTPYTTFSGIFYSQKKRDSQQPIQMQQNADSIALNNYFKN
jgi:hypothetical protein